MRIIVVFTAALFTFSTLALTLSTQASADGDCTWGHSTKTAESNSQSIAETAAPQTPKPNSGG